MAKPKTTPASGGQAAEIQATKFPDVTDIPSRRSSGPDHYEARQTLQTKKLRVAAMIPVTLFFHGNHAPGILLRTSATSKINAPRGVSLRSLSVDDYERTQSVFCFQSTC
jgi:hypothetical protein